MVNKKKNISGMQSLSGNVIYTVRLSTSKTCITYLTTSEAGCCLCTTASSPKTKGWHNL